MNHHEKKVLYFLSKIIFDLFVVGIFVTLIISISIILLDDGLVIGDFTPIKGVKGYILGVCIYEGIYCFCSTWLLIVAKLLRTICNKNLLKKKQRE